MIKLKSTVLIFQMLTAILEHAVISENTTEGDTRLTNSIPGSTDDNKITAGVDTTPTNYETTPTNKESTSTNDKILGSNKILIGDNTGSTDGKTTPTEDIKTSTDDAITSKEDKATPTDISKNSTDDAAKSTDGVATPTDDATTSKDGEATPTDDATTSKDGEATPTDDATTSKDGEATPTDGATTSKDGEATPTEDSKSSTGDTTTSAVQDTGLPDGTTISTLDKTRLTISSTETINDNKSTTNIGTESIDDNKSTTEYVKSTTYDDTNITVDLNNTFTVTPPPFLKHEDARVKYTFVKSEIFKTIILADTYDKYSRPPGINGSGPVIVSISMLLRNLENIDDIDMQYTVQMTFREEWIDPRLRYDHLHQVEYIQLSSSTSIWVPDVFFSNEKSGSLHELMVPNFFGRIYSNGRVMASYRITMTLSCPMDLHSYPMDKQTCYIKMASYGYTSKDIVLTWPDKKPSTEVADFKMPRFKLTSNTRELCLTVTKTGNYSCLQLKLRFQRQFGYYLIQIYIPCILLVLVSWISFWLEPSATEARVSLAITAILTVVTQTGDINQNVPPASYVKAVDVWTFMIQFMVFSSVLQFSFVNYLAIYQWKRMARRLNIIDEEDWTKTGCELRRQSERKAKRVDNISKILFPVVFVLFNTVYWIAYLQTGD